MYFVVFSVIQRESDVWNLQGERERIAVLLWNESQAQTLLAEVFLLAYESFVGFSAFSTFTSP